VDNPSRRCSQYGRRRGSGRTRPGKRRRRAEAPTCAAGNKANTEVKGRKAAAQGVFPPATLGAGACRPGGTSQNCATRTGVLIIEATIDLL
jgi:hypothetical protein